VVVEAERQRVDGEATLEVGDRRVEIPPLVRLDAAGERLAGGLADGVFVPRCHGCGAAPVEDGVDGRENVGDLEGLLQEAVHPVGVLEVLGEAPAPVDRADHDDGDVPVLLAALDASADVEAVDLGEHRIEEDEIRHVVADHLEGVAAPRGLDHHEASVGQHALEEAPDVILVVDDQPPCARCQSAWPEAPRRGAARPATRTPGRAPRSRDPARPWPAGPVAMAPRRRRRDR
jgi:hypothetical protein